jgi:hypothetical protein
MRCGSRVPAAAMALVLLAACCAPGLPAARADVAAALPPPPGGADAMTPVSVPAPAAPTAADTLQPISAALGGHAGPDPAQLLISGARVCMGGPSPLCCGMLNSVLGDPEHPVSK